MEQKDDKKIVEKKDGLIKEVNKKVFVTDEKGTRKQLLRERKYEQN